MAFLDDPARLRGQEEVRGVRMGASRTAGAVREAVTQGLGAGRARKGRERRERASRRRRQARTGVDLQVCVVRRGNSDWEIHTP